MYQKIDKLEIISMTYKLDFIETNFIDYEVFNYYHATKHDTTRVIQVNEFIERIFKNKTLNFIKCKGIKYC